MTLPKARDGYVGLCVYDGKRTSQQFRLHERGRKNQRTPPVAGMAGTPLPACGYKCMTSWGRAQGLRQFRVRRAF